jgi:hypothetical protein
VKFVGCKQQSAKYAKRRSERLPIVPVLVASLVIPKLSLLHLSLSTFFVSLPFCTTSAFSHHALFCLFLGHLGQTQGKSSTYTASHLRAKARLCVGEAVRIISGCRMSFLTKNRRTSPQDATNEQFPAAQLALLGTDCHAHEQYIRALH